MGSCCASHSSKQIQTKRYRKILWAVMLVNAVMFLIEMMMSYASGSVSLLADSLDFLGDAGNYGLSLFVLTMSLQNRAKASLLKGLTMGIFGVYVLVSTIFSLYQNTLPNYHEMTMIGALALLANGLCAYLLYAFRDGDSNMRGVWLCTRNDMIGNLLVIFAAITVFATKSNIPDVLVAFMMAYLALKSAVSICMQAKSELQA